MRSEVGVRLLLVGLAGCTLAHHPETAVPAGAAQVDWDAILATPGTIEHEAVLSARWAAATSGLVNLEDPAAAELVDGSTPIVLPIHVLRHPSLGVWVVDSGAHELFHDKRVARGIVYGALSNLEVVETMAQVVARQPGPVAGVLVTHMHLDHVLGLPDLPPETPVYVGAGEQSVKSLQLALLRPTYARILDQRAPLRVWHYPAGPEMGAVDVLGDGSLWALETPGHTPGSTSYLAMTTDGPTLFVGDTSHTLWGWEHGVAPGRFTHDGPANAESLKALRAFVAKHPQIRVFVGHELDGAGTGVDETIPRKPIRQ